MRRDIQMMHAMPRKRRDVHVMPRRGTRDDTMPPRQDVAVADAADTTMRYQPRAASSQIFRSSAGVVHHGRKGVDVNNG